MIFFHLSYLITTISFIIISSYIQKLIYYIFHMSKVDPSKLFTWIKLTDDFYLDPDGILGKGAFG